VTIFELRGEWRRLHRMPPPMRLSRDLLTRGITYKLQERAYGGLSTATARKLERTGAFQRAASLIWRCAAANASLIATMTCSCSGAAEVCSGIGAEDYSNQEDPAIRWLVRAKVSYPAARSTHFARRGSPSALQTSSWASRR
jgi:hypothetical protein